MFSSTEANYEVLACGGQVKRLCTLQVVQMIFIPPGGLILPSSVPVVFLFLMEQAPSSVWICVINLDEDDAVRISFSLGGS